MVGWWAIHQSRTRLAGGPGTSMLFSLTVVAEGECQSFRWHETRLAKYAGRRGGRIYTGRVDMKLEVVPVPVADVDRAKAF